MPARPSTASWACSRPEEQEQIRARLADTLRWVVSQRLVPKVGGGRYALLEIMGSNLRTQETIRLGETEGKSFYEIIEASQPFGWRTFDHAGLEAYEQGKITEETALLYCTKRGPVTRGMDNIKKTRGESTTTMHSLRMKSRPDSPRRQQTAASRHAQTQIIYDRLNSISSARPTSPPCWPFPRRNGWKPPRPP